jgi:2Fe-2S ferredoxin
VVERRFSVAFATRNNAQLPPVRPERQPDGWLYLNRNENLMSDEKTQNGGGTTTVEALSPNTVRLTFLPDNKTFEFEHGKLPYQEHGKPESILDIALNFGLHLEHACGGNCACTTCHVVVKKGKELLNEMDDDEADRLDMAADLQLNSRLGCQTVIEKPGEVVVEIPAWNRNYVTEGAGH